MTSPRPRLLVTRPAAQATAWVAALQSLGVDAVALPLIEIGPAPDAAAVRAAWAALSTAGSGFPAPAAMFVSPNAVRECFRAVQAPWPDGGGALALATGPGTAAALQEAGVPPDRIVAPPPDAPRFDSEALWAVVGAWDWRGRTLLVVRGTGGRDWFAATAAAAGAQVRAVCAYTRADPRWGAGEAATCDAAIAAPRDWCWHFSSSEAIDRLLALRPGVDWSASRALATHPRIVERARAAGFGTVAPVGVTPGDVPVALTHRTDGHASCRPVPPHPPSLESSE